MRTRAEWLEIVRRDYKHLTAEAHEFLVDHILNTHPDHQQAVATEPVTLAQPETPTGTPDHSFWLKRIFWAIVALIAVTLFAPYMHAQGTSQIDVICVQNSNLPNGKACFAAPFNLGMSTGFTCSRSGSTVTCTGGGTITNNPGGTSNQLQYNNGGAFGAIASAGLGKVLIDQGSGSPPAFADPQVQGMAADGASTTQNPVIGGGYDTAGTPLIHRFTMASTSPGGSDWGLVTRIAGTVPVSGTFWQATQPVSIASMPSTPVTNAALSNLQFDASNFLKVILQNTSVAVTGTFWQATQPVSGTFWQATQPISGTTTANQGTAGSTNWLFKIMDAAGNARGANVNASNQLSVSCDNGCAGGSSTPADTFSNPTTAGLQQTFPMLWNGTTWDRFYGDKTNGAFVNIKSSVSIPVTGTFWQSVQPVSQSGTWTTGNFPTTVDTNSGNKSASTIRFVLATDQPNLTTALNVNCTSGCTAGGSFADSSAFTFGTTAVGNMSAVVDDVATNTVAENSAGAVRMNTNRILYVDLSKTAANATAVKVDNSAVTQPISAVSLPLPTGAALDSSLATLDTDVKANVTLHAGTNLIGKVGTDQTTHGTTDQVAADITKIGGNAVAADSNGRQINKVYPDTTTTSYHASKKFAASSTTDNAVLPGNATNTAVLTRVLVSCTQTTAGILNVELVKRSTADTSGTSAAITAVPDDANYASAVSAPLSYTGTGPTVGTAIGDLDNAQVGCMAAGTASPNDIYVFKPAKPIVLRGTAQQVAVNLGGAVTGGNITVTFEWMETSTP